MQLHLLQVMRHYFYLLFLLIFYAFGSTKIAAQTSVQLPGGVEFYETNTDKPYLIKPNENLDATIKKNIFVRLTISKKECYVGEPILVVYKLYTRLQSESKLVKQPEFSGCSVIEMTTDDLRPTKEIINGKAYKCYVIRKVQLVPLQEGNIMLGTAEVENSISFFKTTLEVYNSTPILTKNITLGNEPFLLKVNGLPIKNKPENFKNVVGNFSINARVNKLKDTVNDNNNLEITIEGKGNFQDLVCPTIKWSSNFEHFEIESNEILDRLSFPVNGRKIFTIPFSCKKEGTSTILPIQFSYFDSELKQYKTIKTDSINITVLPTIEKIDNAKLSEEVGNSKYIWIVPCIAFVVGIILWLNFFKKEKKNEATKSPIIEEANTPIITKNNTEKLNDLLLLEDDKAYYQAAKNLMVELFENEISNHKKAELKSLINGCNEALYAYNKTLSKEFIFERLEQLI